MVTPGGRPALNAGDLRLHVLDDLPGVFAVAHDHDAADDFATVDVERAAPEIAADLHGGDIAQVERRAAARLAAGFAPRSAAECMRPTPRTTNSAPFSSMVLPPTLRLLCGHGVHHFAKHHAVLLELEGGNFDLPLPDEAADARRPRPRRERRRVGSGRNNPAPRAVDRDRSPGRWAPWTDRP